VRKLLISSLTSVAVVGIVYFLPYGTWAEIDKLPAHPLIVHAVVVLLPLISIILAIGIFKKTQLQKAHIPLIFVLALLNVAVLAAKSSGDSLAAAVGLPEFHAEWGNNLVPLAMALLATFIIYSYFTFYKQIKSISKVISGLILILAVGTTWMTYIVGHSGAQSVWKGKYAQAKNPIAADIKTISLEEVRKHDTYTDCWTVVGDQVFDVTSFINRHPAGSPAIKEMCGKNASEDFLGEHSGQKEPEMWLEKLRIGTLAP